MTARQFARNVSRFCVAILAALIVVPFASSAGAPMVRSTLDRKGALPHHIAWIAYPSVPPAMVKEVDFAVDGKTIWIEHKAPYKVWNTGAFTTSWLTPGSHRFVTALITTTGQRAIDTVAARTAAPPSPPAGLTGSWSRDISKAVAGAYAGTWLLTIDSTGWKIRDPKNGRNWFDVDYLRSGQLRTGPGIWNVPRAPNGGNGGNGWCEDTNAPVTYSWMLSGTSLTLALVGADHCGGQHKIVAGDWTRK
ncbi:MAG TPA: hypothetical protein VF091_03530 [Gaiellaceae bacterium]